MAAAAGRILQGPLCSRHFQVPWGFCLSRGHLRCPQEGGMGLQARPGTKLQQRLLGGRNRGHWKEAGPAQ